MAVMSPTQASVAVESFPPEVCPICAYSLEGLPGEGICPECGNKYDSNELILHGWARGSHATPTNTRGKSLVLSLIPGLWLFNILPEWFSGQISARTLALYVSFWVAVMSWALFRRKQIDHPGGIQVRMNRLGTLQIDYPTALRANPNIAAAKRMPWGKLEIIQLRPTTGQLRLKLQKKVPWWWLADVPVDAELKCPADDAQRVAKLIRAWIAEGPKGLDS